jgi:hypothetical protein
MADELKIAGIMEKLMISAVDCGLPDFVEIAKRLWINDASLVEEYSDQAALFAYCSSQYELNRVALKEAEAQTDNEVRLELTTNGEKVTEQKVAMLVGSTPSVVLLRKKVAMLISLTEAFKQRTQMLISIGADRREEQRGTEMPLPREDRSAILDNLQARVLQVKGTTPLQRKAVREETEGKKKVPFKKIIKKN